MQLPAVAVLVKSVPVGGRYLRVHDGKLTRDGVPHSADPACEVALEWALQCRERKSVGRVVAMCMGAAEADAAVRRMLAMGADDGLLVCDDALREADVRATARVLAAAIQHTGVNLAVFGNESADGSSGTVPAAVAAVLDWPLLSLARVATLEATTIRCERDLAMGTELAETELPAIVSFVAGSVDPRYPTLNDVLGARARSVPQISLASLGVENVAPVS